MNWFLWFWIELDKKERIRWKEDEILEREVKRVLGTLERESEREKCIRLQVPPSPLVGEGLYSYKKNALRRAVDQVYSG